VRSGCAKLLGTAVGDDEEARKRWIAANCTSRNNPLFATLKRNHSEGGFYAHHRYLLLAVSAVPRLNYQLRTQPPSIVADTAMAFDAQVQAVLQSLLQRDKPVSAMARVCSQLPVTSGGLGLRSAQLTAPAAYLGGTAQVMAHAPAALRAPGALGDSTMEAIEQSRFTAQQTGN